MEFQKEKSNTLYGSFSNEPIQAFISYNNAHKSRAEDLKICLEEYCIESFVAIRDIGQSQEWQSALEDALGSADIMIALLSDDFGQSDWTDQEVGVGIGREIPVYPIKIGQNNPHGFLQKYQAIEGNSQECAVTIYKLLLGEDEREVVSESLRQRSKRAYFSQLENLKGNKNFPISNRLAQFLDAIRTLSDEEEQELVDLYNGSRYIFDANEFRQNILSQLFRITDHRYQLDEYSLTRFD
ncbi:MAG: toll/interleukin-1 receptor domain-containing protein [Acidimicrobiia bacterium]|nr:toll/interleukin-1 receptor domain-containing protein [Acidimicrobiia bacterium]MCY4434580.1 toll/interleukin-1 receptor domain-containing protein [bacterium]